MSPVHATEMPTDADIVAMQDHGDREACREQLEAFDATDADEAIRVRRRWWARGIAAQRPGRADQYAQARLGEGTWTVVGHAA